MTSAEPAYLQPYLNAARRHAGGFGSLLWAAPGTQAARFDAICRLVPLAGKTVLDAGCGRADLLDHLLASNLAPADYTGIEAVAPLAKAAMAKSHPRCRIVLADFVQKPIVLFVGAEVVVVSGALNTLSPEVFYATLQRLWDATAEELVFNFLSSPHLAAASFLNWYQRDEVVTFSRRLSPLVRVLEDYLHGDTTIAIRKESADL